jgi:hypothetical protein
MNLVEFFLGLHAATHAHDVLGGPAGPERWLGGLSDDELRLRPAAGVNSLVWLLWHMARTEDVAVNLVVAGRAQVFDDAWSRRMRVARRDMGTGMTAAEVAELSERADVAAVRAYRSAVGLRTREVVLSLPRAAWDEELGLADTTGAAEAGAFGPNDDWIAGVGHRPWQGHSRGHQLGQTTIRHNTAHMGEGLTVRGLAGVSPGARGR